MSVGEQNSEQNFLKDAFPVECSNKDICRQGNILQNTTLIFSSSISVLWPQHRWFTDGIILKMPMSTILSEWKAGEFKH